MTTPARDRELSDDELEDEIDEVPDGRDDEPDDDKSSEQPLDVGQA